MAMYAVSYNISASALISANSQEEAEKIVDQENVRATIFVNPAQAAHSRLIAPTIDSIDRDTVTKVSD